MKHDDTPMWDDPREPTFVRELLKAGRHNAVPYDVERGLSEHLSRIASGAAMPTWAEGAAVVKTGAPVWLGYVILPLVAAGIAGLAWIYAAEPQSTAPATPNAAAVDRAPAQVAAGAAPGVIEPSARPLAAEPSAPAPARSRADAPDLASEHAARANRGTRSHARHGRSSIAPSGPGDSSGANTDSLAAVSGEAGDPAGAIGFATAEANNTKASRASGAEANKPVAPQPQPQSNDEAEKSARATEKSAADEPPIANEAQLEREMQMLAVTQRVLSSNPSRALRLSQQGEREFPNTMFSAERRQLGLLALVKLGRVDEARRVGQPFLAKYPNAPWSERLRRALATGALE